MELGLCIEMALTDRPFEDRFQAAADAGFKNVEMWFVRDGSFDGTPDQLVSLAERAGVRITNTVIGAPDGSLGGGLTDPRNRGQWLARARMTIDFTLGAGIPATIVCTGNAIEGMSDDQMLASVIDGLKPTMDLAEKAGITLLLEPLNTTYDHPGYWLTSSDRGAEICRTLGSSRMRLLFQLTQAEPCDPLFAGANRFELLQVLMDHDPFIQSDKAILARTPARARSPPLRSGALPGSLL